MNNVDTIGNKNLVHGVNPTFGIQSLTLLLNETLSFLLRPRVIMFIGLIEDTLSSAHLAQSTSFS